MTLIGITEKLCRTDLTAINELILNKQISPIDRQRFSLKSSLGVSVLLFSSMSPLDQQRSSLKSSLGVLC